MRISPEAIEEFKKIYREEFGDDLTDDQAQECALRFLRLFQLLLKPLPDSSERYPQEQEF
jgi:hypothetical protein